jgi:hypothetical protein
LPPDVTYILTNGQGDGQLLPAEQPQFFSSLLEAAGAWLDVAQADQLASEIHYLVPVPEQAVTTALERIQAMQSEPIESVAATG